MSNARPATRRVKHPNAVRAAREDIARKRLGKDVDVDYTDIWKAKSRLVQGEAGTL